MNVAPWIVSLFLFLSCIPGALAQSGNRPFPTMAQSSQWSHQFPQHAQQQDDELIDAQRENARKANLQRQAELERDTDTLLQMAKELEQDVDKTNENILSLEVIRKAEQIEKLAKSVKEKMKAN